MGMRMALFKRDYAHSGAKTEPGARALRFFCKRAGCGAG
ncbi:hypothetical protein PSM7751_02930 [Pseudooceanicola marinus]|uniref:Uncharacterized protein n=1 Tax=Pseudooceanicola marinus TaxID=396013 RepID=A0A1X6ZS07_9RHOB|nr:hypothetical protein PSM7751_02930 [Pseudooceanicola marinus]